jgi:predicted amidohydrolase YtcJ
MRWRLTQEAAGEKRSFMPVQTPGLSTGSVSHIRHAMGRVRLARRLAILPSADMVGPVTNIVVGSRLLRLVVALAGSCAAAAPADLVVRRANVITMDPNHPRAQAFAVAAGRFVAVGTDEAVQPFIDAGTRVLDLPGKTVVPGFIDAHAHPGPEYPEDSPWASVDCRPEKVRTIDALVSALKRKADRTPSGQWVIGSRYQETKLGRHPTRWDLDRASTNHPIIISHSSGHQSVCNSFALELAKVTRDTPDPAGGKFVRDERGELTGLLQERAASVVRSAGPRRPTPPETETLAAYRAAIRRYLSRGITSVHVAGTSPGGAAMLERARSDQLPLRFYIMLRESSIADATRRHNAGAPGDDVRYGAIKLFHGNSLSGQTCWLSKPYEHRPDYFGVPPARFQADLDALILRVHEAGLQACVHSNGDREIEMVLNAFEPALKAKPRPDHRHRIEHGSVVTEPLLRRIKQLGVVMVPHSYIWEHGDKMENYGAWRWDWMHPARSLIDLGIPMAGHSDDPVSAADPLLRMQDMVTRTSAEGKIYGARQRVTVEEALRAWTLGGAFASFEEHHKGSIETGKLADFVVLAADPARVKAEAIKDIVIEKTVVGGKVVFEAR